MIDRRWKQWQGWVQIHLDRTRPYDAAVAAAETARLRQRHVENVLAMTHKGISMRLIRRHRLDDPRITDETRAILVRAVMERRKKARVKRRENLANRINIAAALNPRALDLSFTNCQGTETSNEAHPQALRDVTDPEELQQAIESIRQRVSHQFQLSELRDQDLTRRSHRQIIAFPRQIAICVTRQVTAATLQEIGRQFGGMHHSTVLHSINKIERMRRLDEELDRAITRLMDALPRR
jgi:chromosomal replication initiation ATPase DnaA